MKSLTKAQKQRPATGDQNDPGRISQVNPLLLNVPNVPTVADAMKTMTQLPDESINLPHTKNAIETLANIFIPTLQHSEILIDVVNQVRNSYRARNVDDPTYRAYTISANELLHCAFDRHGHRIPSKFAPAPNACSRGIFVCAPARTGRTQLANLIQRYLGRGVQIVRIPIHENGQFLEFLQLKTLRVSWPVGGRLQRFAKSFLVAFDSELGTDYSRRTRGPFRQDDGIVEALCALGTASNLGLLIVERINTKASITSAAIETWDALGAFTKSTGIPVLCLSTPGGALGLVEQCGALGDLATSSHAISPPEIGSANWNAACNIYYKSSISTEENPTAPEWFSRELWRHSQGRYGLATQICYAVALNCKTPNAKKLTPEFLEQSAKACLTLYEPHINACHMAARGGKFKNFSIRSHGDWLPLPCVLPTSLQLQFIEGAIAASGA